MRHSTDPREVGTMVDKSAEACYGCHAQTQPLSRLNRKDRMRIFVELDGRRTLAIIQPIESTGCSSASCHAHPAERQILGVIDVHLTLDAVDAQLAEHRAQMMGFTLFAALIISLTGGGFIFLFVHRPVRELIYGTLRIGRGDLGHRIHVQSRDELGLLAASFNQMAEDLGQAYGQLQEWAHRLEERVPRQDRGARKGAQGDDLQREDGLAGQARSHGCARGE